MNNLKFVLLIFVCFIISSVRQTTQDALNLASTRDELPLKQHHLPLAEHVSEKVKRQVVTSKSKNKIKLALLQPQDCGINAKFLGKLKNPIPGTTDWPWIAALLRTDGYSNFCGGVLLNRNYVLTAAHCVFRYGKNDILVRLGEYDFQLENETVYKDFALSEIKVHSEYDPTTEHNDIALLKLNGSATYSNFIRPICLPKAKAKINQTAVVAGWGTLFYGGPLSNVLLEVSIPVWDLQECVSRYSQPVFDTNLCAASYEGGKDACQGDSGGPLLTQQANGRWVSIGIVSWGISCGDKDQPGIYTNVDSYLGWIRNNMQDAKI